MVGKYEQVMVRRSKILVIIVIIITMGFLTILPDIRIEMDFSKFMPDNEVITASREMSEYFGEENELYYIMVSGKGARNNVLTPGALREQYNVSVEAVSKDGVVDVYGLAVMMNTLTELNFNRSILEVGDHTIELMLDTFQSIANSNGSYNGYSPSEFKALGDIILSKDFDIEADDLSAEHTIILVALNPELTNSELKDLSKGLRDTLDDIDLHEIELDHTGSYLITSDIDKIGNQNIITLGIAIILLVIIVLALTFRRLSFVLLPMMTLSIAIIWTFGTMALLGIKFTLIDIAVVPLLLGLGVDYTVHTSRRYLSELHKEASPSKAMWSAQSAIVPAIFLAVLTTTIAFLSNLSSSIEPIREFGLVCAIGIFFAFILTLLFHNTCRMLIDRQVGKGKKESGIIHHNDTKMVKIAIRTASQSVKWFPVLAITCVALISSIALVGAVNIRTEFSETDFLPGDWSSIETSNEINSKFQAGKYSEVHIFIRDELSIPQNIATQEMLLEFQNLEASLLDDEYVVKIDGKPRMESPLTLVQMALSTNDTLQAYYDTDANLLPDSSDLVSEIYDILLASGDIADPLTGQSYGELMASFLHKNEDGYYDAAKITIYVRAKTTAEIETLKTELENEMPDFLDTNVVITGNTIMTIVTIDALQSGQIKSTIISIILAFILLVILYRSIGLGLISLVPVILSTLWILGTMYFVDISLNVLTVMVTALTIGLGLDYAIYIVTRYQEERKERSIEDAINVTIKSTGSALFISGVTTVCGFAVLVLSPIPIIAHFGFIISITIIYCGVLAVIVIPILLGTWEKLRGNPEEVIEEAVEIEDEDDVDDLVEINL